MSKNLFIRADGSSKIGLGHIVRCIALANMLKDEYLINFVCKEIPQKFVNEIISLNFSITQIEDENNFFELLTGDEIVVLDHYGMDSNYQKHIKGVGSKLVCIDDLHNKEFFADLIVNHSPGAKQEDYKAKPYTKFALGFDYALLRPLFLKVAKQQQQQQSVKMDTAFVCFGGSDINDFTLKITKVLLQLEDISCINIIVGEVYQKTEIFELEKIHLKINIYKNLSEKELLRMMLESDFGIVPASSISLELMAVNRPIVSGYYVENQRFFYQYLKDNDLVYGVDDFNTVKAVKLSNQIMNVIKHGKKNSKVIDGNQKNRFINRMKKL